MNALVLNKLIKPTPPATVLYRACLLIRGEYQSRVQILASRIVFVVTFVFVQTYTVAIGAVGGGLVVGIL